MFTIIRYYCIHPSRSQGDFRIDQNQGYLPSFKASLKAICLDADGVVVAPQMQFSKLLAAKYSITPEMTRHFFETAFNDCLVDQAKLEDVLPPFLDKWGWQSTVQSFIDLWLAADHVIDQRVINFVQALRQRGMICCLATSQERNRATYMRTKMGFDRLFDHLFFSCEIGIQKPDPRFYRRIENELGVSKKAILFWDDSGQNVEAAREIGWNAEVYGGYPDFEAVTKRYLGTGPDR